MIKLKMFHTGMGLVNPTRISAIYEHCGSVFIIVDGHKLQVSQTVDEVQALRESIT